MPARRCRRQAAGQRETNSGASGGDLIVASATKLWREGDCRQAESVAEFAAQASAPIREEPLGVGGSVGIGINDGANAERFEPACDITLQVEEKMADFG